MCARGSGDSGCAPEVTKLGAWLAVGVEVGVGLMIGLGTGASTGSDRDGVDEPKADSGLVRRS